MHKTSGLRDPAVAFPLPGARDDAKDRREANRTIAVSAAGLAATGAVELVLAVLTGSVGLLGDAIHNLSDVSTSAVVFLGFRLSRRVPTERYPYGLERAEDLAGVGIAVVIWASAAFAGFESIRGRCRGCAAAGQPGPGDTGQDPLLPPGRPEPPADRHPPIVPAAFRKLDAVAVLTGPSLPAPQLGSAASCAG